MTGAPAAQRTPAAQVRQRSTRQLQAGGSHQHTQVAAQALGGGQRSPAGGAASPSTTEASIRQLQRTAGNRATHDLLSGEALPPGLRERMESRFGVDFAGVRVHHDEAAAGVAQAEAAKAFTAGTHIVFADGEWQPDTTSGQWLLAHELAHVVQQSRGGPAARPGRATPLEADAHTAADAVAAGTGGPVTVAGAAGPGVSKADEDDPAKKKPTSTAPAVQAAVPVAGNSPGTNLADPPTGPSFGGPPFDQLVRDVGADRPDLAAQASTTPRRQVTYKTARAEADKAAAGVRRSQGMTDSDVQAGHTSAARHVPESGASEEQANDPSKFQHLHSRRSYRKQAPDPLRPNDGPRENMGLDVVTRLPDGRLRINTRHRAQERLIDDAVERARPLAAPGPDGQVPKRADGTPQRGRLTPEGQAAAGDEVLWRTLGTGLDQREVVQKRASGLFDEAAAIENSEAVKAYRASKAAQNQAVPSPAPSDDPASVPKASHPGEGATQSVDSTPVPPGGAIPETGAQSPAGSIPTPSQKVSALAAGPVPTTPAASELGLPLTADPTPNRIPDPSVAAGGTNRPSIARALGELPSGTPAEATTTAYPTPKPTPLLVDTQGAIAPPQPESAGPTAKLPSAKVDEPSTAKPPVKTAAASAPEADLIAPKASQDLVAPPPAPKRAAPTPLEADGPLPVTSFQGKSGAAPAGGHELTGSLGKANSVLGALLEAKVRHQRLVDEGHDDVSAWLEGGGRAALTLGTNLKGGTIGHVVNAFNSFERATQAGQDPGEALVSALGEVGGSAIAQRVTKPSVAGLIVEGVNTGAQLIGAPEEVTLTTAGATEFVPSQVITRTITAGARSWSGLLQAAAKGDASGLDKLVTDFKKGGAGPWLQGYAQMVDIGVDVASGDSFTKAVDKAAAAGKYDSEGNETWASKSGGKLGDAFYDLGENEKALRGDYSPVVQGWAQLSRIGSEMVRGKSFTEAAEVAGNYSKGGLLEKAGSGLGDAAYTAHEKVTEVLDEDIPKAKAAIAHKATELRDDAVALRDRTVERASEITSSAAEMKDEVVNTAIDYKDRALGAAEAAISNPGQTYDNVKNRLKKAFTW